MMMPPLADEYCEELAENARAPGLRQTDALQFCRELTTLVVRLARYPGCRGDRRARDLVLLLQRTLPAATDTVLIRAPVPSPAALRRW
jgi:hypothetical protein